MPPQSSESPQLNDYQKAVMQNGVTAEIEKTQAVFECWEFKSENEVKWYRNELIFIDGRFVSLRKTYKTADECQNALLIDELEPNELDSYLIEAKTNTINNPWEIVRRRFEAEHREIHTKREELEASLKDFYALRNELKVSKSETDNQENETEDSSGQPGGEIFPKVEVPAWVAENHLDIRILSFEAELLELETKELNLQFEELNLVTQMYEKRPSVSWGTYAAVSEAREIVYDENSSNELAVYQVMHFEYGTQEGQYSPDDGYRAIGVTREGQIVMDGYKVGSVEAAIDGASYLRAYKKMPFQQ